MDSQQCAAGREHLRNSDTYAELVTPEAVSSIRMPRGGDVSLPPAPWSSWDEVRQFRHGAYEMRYRLVARASGLSAEERLSMDKPYDAPLGGELKMVNQFMQDWYAIWDGNPGAPESVSDARNAWALLRSSPGAARLPPLQRVQSRMTDERFDALSPFLGDPKREATNNGAERLGRCFRQIQRVHYRLRSDAAVSGALDA